MLKEFKDAIFARVTSIYVLTYNLSGLRDTSSITEEVLDAGIGKTKIELGGSAAMRPTNRPMWKRIAVREEGGVLRL